MHIGFSLGQESTFLYPCMCNTWSVVTLYIIPGSGLNKVGVVPQTFTQAWYKLIFINMSYIAGSCFNTFRSVVGGNGGTEGWWVGPAYTTEYNTVIKVHTRPAHTCVRRSDCYQWIRKIYSSKWMSFPCSMWQSYPCNTDVRPVTFSAVLQFFYGGTLIKTSPTSFKTVACGAMSTVFGLFKF
jgi:hypothetical protein